MRRVIQGLVVVAALVVGMVGWAEAQGILNTRHNLSSTSGAASALGDIKTAGTGEVCVFCHTPHGADTAVKAPLWNRAISTNTSGYTMYNSATLDAAPDKNNMGVSLACLSCHDGSIAFDALRNMPGSGGYNPSPAAGGVSNWTFTNAASKTMPTDRVTNLGTDLSNDHPVAMLYSDARSPSATSADETAGFYATATLSNGRVVVQNTSAAVNAQVPLYEGRVQCASCHDPHRSDTPTFLRVANDPGSKLCRTCHKKDG